MATPHESPPPFPQKPVRAGQYYLLEKIAQGGMAEIYKGLAYDLAGIKKTVCIKKILPHIAASREFIDMLVDEAKIAVQLSQGNIAQVYDLGKAGEDYFIVMEFVEGQSLSKIFKKAARKKVRIPVPIVCHIAAEIAGGLSYMHNKTDEAGRNLHIVHRDISPQNIVVSYSGTVKIIDFGIAKAAVKVGHTESGILKGKFAYMSPEHAAGDKVDHRSDIFSLGVIFYELLTGARLFKGKDNKETVKNVKRARVPLPSTVVEDIPEALDAIVLKALAKNRRHRYPFASDFQEELLRFLHTHYPDFKPSQVAEFVRELFKEELVLLRKLGNQEAKTPHLILEKTRDRPDEENTEGGGPIDWREFMLEAEWPEGEMDRGPGTMDHGPEEVDEEAAELTSRKWFPRLGFRTQTVVIGLLLISLLAGGIFYWTEDRGPWTVDRGPWTVDQRPRTTDQGPRTTPITLPAKIMVESNPPGAQIYLNDRDTGKITPAELEGFKTNQKLTLGLHLDKYKYYQTEFSLRRGETKHFHVEMGLDYGSLRIVPHPAAARVFIDGEPFGSGTVFRENLEPGQIVRVQVEQEGYHPFRQDLKIEAGKQHIVNARLERL
ncbi:MAG: serine/threonine protein kinase [Deltaproteobacteria bacterium]|nr:serine/threonine protein kinase [Deltaproteobacteria bacterium]